MHQGQAKVKLFHAECAMNDVIVGCSMPIRKLTKAIKLHKVQWRDFIIQSVLSLHSDQSLMV